MPRCLDTIRPLGYAFIRRSVENRGAMAVFVAILVMTIAYGASVAPASAQQSGILWSPYPTEYGATVGGAVTVEAGQILTYTLTGTDGDTRKLLGTGAVERQELRRDVMRFFAATIESCPGWHEIIISGGTGLDTVWTFSGRTVPRLEQTRIARDVWLADDLGQLPTGERGDRDDGPALGPFTKFVIITPNCGWIAGRVTMAGSGEPVAGAIVSLYSGGSLVCQVETAADGSYQFRAVLAGEYTITATAPWGVQQTKKANVSKGQRSTVDFELSPPSQ